MHLMPEIHDLTNPETLAKVVQLQALQAHFLASTETRQIEEGELDHKPSLYNNLQAMMIPHWQANKPAQPLFHAISPMVNKGGYLVHYLPQHRIKAQAAIAAIATRHPAEPTPPIIANCSMARPIQPVPHLASTGPHPQADIDNAFRLQFTMPFGLNPTSHSQQSCTQFSMQYHRIPQPSNYKLFQWLQALGQLSQNTAWDRWRYQLGILQELRDSRNANQTVNPE